MDEFITSNKDAISFQSILFQQLERILRISCHEFHGGYWTTKMKGDYKEKVYVPSTTKEYIQAIESMYDLLRPHFDEKMKGDAKKILEDIEKVTEEVAKDKEVNNKTYVLSQKKLVHVRKLFQQMNMLLERKDYLKGTEYIEE